MEVEERYYSMLPWRSAMEVEEWYYSMAPNSCDLTVYVGYIRSLRSSPDAVESGQSFAERLGRQLEGLECRMDHSDMAFEEAAGRGDVKSESGGSNYVNNGSSGGESGANKDDSKSEGNNNNNDSGCANSSGGARARAALEGARSTARSSR